MYIHMEDVAFAIYHYFTVRAKTDVEFAVQVCVDINSTNRFSYHIIIFIGHMICSLLP